MLYKDKCVQERERRAPGSKCFVGTEASDRGQTRAPSWAHTLHRSSASSFAIAAGCRRAVHGDPLWRSQQQATSLSGISTGPLSCLALPGGAQRGRGDGSRDSSGAGGDEFPGLSAAGGSQALTAQRQGPRRGGITPGVGTLPGVARGQERCGEAPRSREVGASLRHPAAKDPRPARHPCLVGVPAGCREE